jgi:hypothetical protein
MPYTLGTQRIDNNIVDLNDLKTEVSDRLLPDVTAGDSNKTIVVNGGEDGFQTAIVATGGGTTFVTPPNVSGPVSGLIADNTNYAYSVSGSDSIDPESTNTITYHWSIVDGNLSASTGTNVNANFDLGQNGATQTISVYAMDDQGNQSETINLEVAVQATQAPSGLSLSLPSLFKHTIPDTVDVTVGDNGGDSSLTYSWERNLDSGVWVSTGFSNAAIKAPTLSLSSGASVLVRCTVSNSAAGTTETSSPITVTASLPDADSQFVDTTVRSMASTEMTSTALGASLLEVPTGLEAGASQTFYSDAIAEISLVYIENNKVVVCYDGSGLAYSAVGVISGTGISWGTPEIFNDSTISQISATYIGNDKVVICYVKQNAGESKIGTINTTANTMTWSTGYEFEPANLGFVDVTSIGNDKVVVVYRGDAGHSLHGTSCVGTVGASIVWETPVEFNSVYSNYVQITSIGNNKVVACYTDIDNMDDGKACVGTVTGTSISWGSPQLFATGASWATSFLDITYVENDKVIVTYKDLNNSDYGTSSLGTVNTTANTINWETPIVFTSDTFSWSSIINMGNNKVIIAYRDLGGTNYGTSRLGVISGATLSWGDPIIFENGAVDNVDIISIDNNNAVICYEEKSVADYGISVVITNNTTPFAQNDLIQLPNGQIDTVSAVDVSVSLTPYSVIEDISSTSVKINRGTDVTLFNDGDSVIINGDTDVLTTINGTPTKGSVVGTELVTFSTSSTFKSAAITYSDIVYARDNKVVVFWSDTWMRGRVGTISGNTITWEAFNPVVATNVCSHISATSIGNGKVVVCYLDHSNYQAKYAVYYVNEDTNDYIDGGTLHAGQAEYISVTKLENDKVIVCFSDSANSANGTSCVGTLSGTSMSWGSISVFNSGDTTFISSTLVDTNKIVVSYRDGANGGRGIVGTISGTSVSWGTEVLFSGGSWVNDTSATYISNDKVVFAYKDTSAGNHGVGVVGTISGTSISFGTPVTFKSDIISYPTIESFGDKVVVSYANQGAAQNGSSQVGTISGTSISWASPIIFSTGNTKYLTSTTIALDNILTSYFLDEAAGSGVVDVLTYDGTTYNTTLVLTDNRPTNPLTVNTITPDGDSAQAIYLTDATLDAGGISSAAYTSDANTELLIHSNTTDGSTTFTDSSSNIHSITNNSSNAHHEIDQARFGSTSIHFDGTDDSLKLTTLGALGSGDWVIDLWFRTTDVAGSLFDFRNNAASAYVPTVEFSGGNIDLYIYDGWKINGDIDILADTWYHYALVKSGGTLRQFINGVQDGSDYSDSYTYVASGEAWFGIYSNGSSDFEGYMDEIRVSTGTDRGWADGFAPEVAIDVFSGTVKNISTSYTVPTIAQDGGQDDFLVMDLEVQFDRNKFAVTESTGDVVINHGGTAAYPFLNGDKVMISGDTDVVTTINADPVRDSVAGTGDLVAGSSDLISSGDSVNFGGVVYIGNNKVLMIFADTSNSYYGTSVIGTIDGNNITWGTPQVFESGQMRYPSVAYMDNNMVVATYADDGNSNYCKSCVGTISGDSVSWESPLTIHSVYCSWTSVVLVDTNKVLMTYSISGNHYSRIGTLSGTTMSWAATNSFDGNAVINSDLVYLGSNKVAWVATIAEATTKSRVGVISGTNTSWYTLEAFSSAALTYMTLASIGNNKVVACYKDVANSSYGTSRVGTVGATSITWETPVVFNSGNSMMMDVSSIDNDKVVVTYADTANSNYGTMCEGTVTGTSISWETPIEFNSDTTFYCNLCHVSSDILVTVYKNNTTGKPNSRVISFDLMNYTSTISTTDTIPANVATIELLPVELESDLNIDGGTLQSMTETYTAVNSTTMKATATLSGDSGPNADIKLKVNNTDGSDLSVTRIQADFEN